MNTNMKGNDDMKYDFSGWATKSNLKCSDGRTIMKDAFKDNDGDVVPLVWNHEHNDPSNILGHALLQNRDGGVYAYCSFNDTEKGEMCKSMVKHNDIQSLSIYANKLVQQGGNVIHGEIREVSLVLAGANPGAYIDNVMIHGEFSNEQAVIYNNEDIDIMPGSCLYHGYNTNTNTNTNTNNENEDDKTINEIFNTFTDEQKQALYIIIGQAVEDTQNSNIKHTDSDIDGNTILDENQNGKTIGEIFESLNEEQKQAAYALIGAAIEDAKNNIDKEGNDDMKHNVFEGQEFEQDDYLSHSEMKAIIDDGKRFGSLKESVIQHGIEDINFLFPDAQAIDNVPSFIKRDTGWVSKVMSDVYHTPFSRIKSVFANITEEDARAKGYIKGKQKKDEVFTLLKRTTTPQTVYKKQKLDRDDVVDITNFDVIGWIKGEMRLMLDEELARAFLIGDGRLSSSDDKINETNIRPIYNDDDLYTIKTVIESNSSATSDKKAREFIRAIIKSRKEYKGSGSPKLYATDDIITDCLLLEDSTGRLIYADEAALAKTLRVSEIVTVPVMEGAKGAKGGDLLGIVVNLKDYAVGADKGGAVNMFDDFDIDYNQMKYLIETRCSGALRLPYSAIAVETATV